MVPGTRDGGDRNVADRLQHRPAAQLARRGHAAPVCQDLSAVARRLPPARPDLKDTKNDDLNPTTSHYLRSGFGGQVTGTSPAGSHREPESEP